MENEFLDKVEDNVVVRIWSEKMQLQKGDSLAKGYVSELWDYTRISVTQNSLQELKRYGIGGALAQYWNPAYSCFTFGKVDLVPTVEEYTALLRCPRFQVDKAYSRSAYVPTFWKKLRNITGMSEQWITFKIKQKGECKCILWKNLRDLILAHPDWKRKVDVFTLGYVDEAVSDLFDRFDKEFTHVPAILAETFRSLSACRRAVEGRFIGCAQLLLAWFHSHFWKVDRISYRVFSEMYSLLKEIVATPRRDDISEENWIALLQNLQEEDVEWKAPSQCSSRQFALATHGLAQCEFSYRGDNYKKKVKEISHAWNQAHRMKKLAVGSMMTPEYNEWRKLERKIERFEEEKMHLRLDVDVQKLEAEKLRKGKNKAEEDLDSLKTDYKKLCLSFRTAGLRKTSE
ncbi:hypothetical protein Godav_019591 [Gossypium davidsonii]|uniref:DUF7745 domain-containing protein n=1 Tax=Gossypium davidsonii TaxID=34287 RepID=A0A7J8R084_GOSDV|nr:hypothetical protein [Gossypium davidsonii]